jgi:hypothetical protein
MWMVALALTVVACGQTTNASLRSSPSPSAPSNTAGEVVAVV